MLKIGGALNLLISAAHLIGLFWEQEMYYYTGISAEMTELATVHFLLPTMLTIFVAVAFAIFGLYGLSAAGVFRKLPWLKIGVFSVASIYLLRGIGELLIDQINNLNSTLELSFSVAALTIGVLYLIGGLRKWSSKQNIAKATNINLE